MIMRGRMRIAHREKRGIYPFRVKYSFMGAK